MKINLAKFSGFCMGVQNALVRIVSEINKTEEDILIYGSLIHNPQTVKILENRGLKTINQDDTIENKTVAIRTHGIPLNKLKKIEKESKRYINLTCPRVARVQKLIEKYSKEGYFTIITGDEDHAETIALKSYAESGVFLITKLEDAVKTPRAEKYIVVSQTTFEKKLFEKIVKQLEKEKTNLKIFNTICNSTNKRQGELIKKLQNGIDTLIVAGGKNSANTRRLAQIGIDNNIKTFHIETESELKPMNFDNTSNVLVTAGASTPGWIVNNILEKLYTIKYKNYNPIVNLLKNSFEFAIRFNFAASLGAFFMSLFAQEFLSLPIDYYAALISSFFIFAISNINNYYEIDLQEISSPLRYKLSNKFKKLIIPLALLSIFFSFILLTKYNYTATIITISYLLGSICLSQYVKTFFQNRKAGIFTKTYYSKNITSSIGWVAAATTIPILDANANFITIFSVIFYVFSFAFLRQTALDMISYQGDIIIGKDSFQILFGTKATKNLSLIFSIVSIILFGLSCIYSSNYYFLILIFNIIYFFIILLKITNLNFLIPLKYEMLVDLNLFIFVLFNLIILSLN